MAFNPSINLVRGRRPRVFDQFINWALTVGRAVVILTELVALSAFFYRFFLDQQLIALHDKILQEQSIVNQLQKNENTYRNLQNRLKLATSIISNDHLSVSRYQDILAMITPDIALKTLIIDPNSMTMTMDVPTVLTLGTLVNNFKAYPPVTNVSIDKIENKTSIGLIGVNIALTLKPISKTP